MNVPNRLTLARIIMIPVFLVLLYLSFPGHTLIALLVFLIAAGTDFADGYLARKRNQITDFGKFMDPLADKLLIVIAREFAVTALRLVAVDKGRVIAAGLSGKVKTAATILCIIVMLTGITWLHPVLNTILVAIVLLTTVWSGVVYFYKNRDLLHFSM